jgi:hypothetical protein
MYTKINLCFSVHPINLLSERGVQVMDFPTASAHLTTRKQMVRYHMRGIPKTKKPTGLMALHGNNIAVFDFFTLVKGLKTAGRFNLFKITNLQL